MWKADIAKIILICKNNYVLIIFAKPSIIDVRQGSKYVLVSDFEYSKTLNMLGLHSIVNMSEYAWIISEHAWICQNMHECA